LRKCDSKYGAYNNFKDTRKTSRKFSSPELWTGVLVDNLKITDVQFSEDFLTVTVKNTGDTRYDWDVVTVTEVMHQPERDWHDLNQIVSPYEVPMSIPIHIGEEASITLGYDWVSGEAYQIKVTSSRGNHWLFRYAVAP
jgi:hypothetical protein